MNFACGATLALVLVLAAHAETLIFAIDAGSPIDSNFTGGAAYLIPQALLPPGTTDATLRFGTAFSYRVPSDNCAYIVTFRFIEPNMKAAGQRIFSVRINNQVAIDRLDLVAEAGYLTPLSRSVVVMGSDSALRIHFEAHVRSAVVSAIQVQPLVVPLPFQAEGLLSIHAANDRVITGVPTPPDGQKTTWVLHPRKK